MRRLALAAILVVVAACSSAGTPAPNSPAPPPTAAPDNRVTYWHDDTHFVSCWISQWGMSCLPDKQVVITP